MKGKLTIIAPDSSIEVREFDRPATLEDLQPAVGGYIEIVPGFHSYAGARCVALCNEEGKLEDLQFNLLATALWHAHVPYSGDVLVGPVVICQGDDEFMGAL